jgi:amino acid transporter
MGGWGIIVADVIVLANLAQIAGQYGFELIGANGLAGSTLWTTVAGVVWIGLMTWLCYIGIEISATLQKLLLGVEVVMLALLSAAALIKVYTGHGTAGSAHISLSWFNPLNIDSPGAFTKGILAAIFIYWGWDTAVSVNEETEDRASTPGRAALISTVLLLLIYAVVSTSAQAFAGVGATGSGLANPQNSGDVLSGLGNEVFGSHGIGWFLSKLLIFMVLTSSAASTQTSILPTARTTLSMAAHKALPQRFARIHAKYLTPTWSTVGMGVVSAVFYVVLSKVSTAVLTDSIGSIGLSIAFYYGLTGLACVWYYRKVLTRSAHDLWFKGILPGLGALTLFALFVYAAFFVYADPGYGTGSVTLPLLGQVGRVSVIGVGSLLVGVLVMIGYSLARPAFFDKQVVTVSAAEPS